MLRDPLHSPAHGSRDELVVDPQHVDDHGGTDDDALDEPADRDRRRRGRRQDEQLVLGAPPECQVPDALDRDHVAVHRRLIGFRVERQ